MCHRCGAKRATVLQKFGGPKVVVEGIKSHACLIRVFHDAPLDRRIPDFGAHGILPMAIVGLNGMISVLTVKGAGRVARTVRLGKWGPRRQMPKDKSALNGGLHRTSSRRIPRVHCCTTLTGTTK